MFLIQHIIRVAYSFIFMIFCCAACTKQTFLTLLEFELLKKKYSEECTSKQLELKKNFLWHYYDPYVGFYKKKSGWYIPHCFDFKELAPAQGKGITVVVLDNGVAAFDVNEYPEYKKHRDLLQPNELHALNLTCATDELIKKVILESQRLLHINTRHAALIEKIIYEFCCYKKMDVLD